MLFCIKEYGPHIESSMDRSLTAWGNREGVSWRTDIGTDLKSSLKWVSVTEFVQKSGEHWNLSKSNTLNYFQQETPILLIKLESARFAWKLWEKARSAANEINAEAALS